MKKKMIKKEAEMHQHMKAGVPIGRLHPENAEHKNKKTQTRHNETVLTEIVQLVTRL